MAHAGGPDIEWTRRFRSIKLLIAVLVSAFAIMTGLALKRYFTIESRLNYSVSENIIWAAAQAEVELNHFLSVLTDSGQDAGPETRARLLERFDVLWSRIGLYKAGTLRRSLDANPELRQRIEELASDLKLVDDSLHGPLSAEEMARIRTLMRRHLEPLRRLTIFALTTDREERQGIQRTQQEVRQELSVLITLLLLTLAGAGGYLVASERKAQKHLAVANFMRKEASDAWRRLHEAVEAINEGFVLFDSEDRLVHCNSKIREIYALSSEALVPGVRFEDLLRYGIARGQYRDADADPEAWLKARLERRNGNPRPFEQALGDGRWLIVSDRRTSDGCRVGIRTDITEIKRNVAELTAARENLRAQADHMRKLKEAADTASEAKTGFMAMISHEIRTPMNAVLGLAGLISETRLTETQKRFVTGIEDAGAHLLALINDILDFSRLEAGKEEARPTATSIHALIEGLATMIGVLAEEKGIGFSVRVDETVPASLMLDPAHLKQILINVLGNAVKFTEEGSVSLDVACADDGPERVRLKITVSDTGKGIPEPMQQRIFDPFERAAAAGAGAGGTGLGLAISSRLVAMMDGSLTLARSDQSGTAFLIDLPARLCPSLPASPRKADGGVASVRREAGPATQALSILVAEDTPASQLVIRALLEHRGHHVTLVSDGQAALDAASDRDFDLVILDIQMPVKSGYEAVTGIRQLSGPRGEVLVAALTAQAFKTDRERALAAGFDFHLSKPIRSAEIDRFLGLVADRMSPPRRRGAERLPDVPAGLPDRLDELERACGKATLKTLLGSAIADIEHESLALLAAEKTRDHDGIRLSAHKLAGVLGQYGSLSASNSATAVENADAAAIETWLPPLHMEIARTLQRLRERRAA